MHNNNNNNNDFCTKATVVARTASSCWNVCEWKESYQCIIIIIIIIIIMILIIITIIIIIQSIY